MSAVGREMDPVSGLQVSRFGLAVDLEVRIAVDEHDPFVVVLVVPEALWGCVAVRNDTLDPDTGTGEKLFEELVGARSRNTCEEAAGCRSHSHRLTRIQRRESVSADSGVGRFEWGRQFAAVN
jgi:hypothetical protein